jgi:hypothetical protein
MVLFLDLIGDDYQIDTVERVQDEASYPRYDSLHHMHADSTRISQGYKNNVASHSSTSSLPSPKRKSKSSAFRVELVDAMGL